MPMIVKPKRIFEDSKIYHWDDLSNPCWLKEWVDGKEWPSMLMVNYAYIQNFGLDMKLYPGKTDVQMWGEKAGTGFSIFDYQAILKYPQRIMNREYVPDRQDQKKGQFMKVYKQAYRDDRLPRWLIAGEIHLDTD